MRTQPTLRKSDRRITDTLIHHLLMYRRPLIVVLHLILAGITNSLAFWLRFDGEVPETMVVLWRQTLPWLMVTRGLVFMPFRLYEGLWRYTGIWDLRSILGGVLASSLAFAVLVYGGMGLTGYPRSIVVIDAVLLVCCMGGSRLLRRLSREPRALQRKKHVLIYGAGNAGEMIVRDMKNNGAYAYEPIGFVDDDPTKTGQRIHGVQVLGTRQDLRRIMASTQIHEVLVAIPSADPPTLQAVVQALEPFKVPITTLPNLRDILDNKVAIQHIRHLVVEDLLPRVPVGLDPTSVRHLIAGKRVLVTGAGGSIGAELCRQIAAAHPQQLILLERYENSLYAIANDLACYDNVRLQCLIGDVTDAHRVHMVMEMYHPELIFHAAAHKHVPLMEVNPCEAVKNNVFGTRTLAEAAAKHGAERFMLISTDKAVNPSSIMGATKRIAEMVVQSMARQSQTRFLTVRFGNVLGSNGSVVPRFLEQIHAGGPVTVTHPEVRRYFMLIPEAVSLVLHATALGQRGAIYVLDMGEQIKVLDMACNLIRLAGYVPYTEVPIVFIGLRPGEKLSEELVEADETVEPSGVDKISQVSSTCPLAPEMLAQHLATLERLAHQEETEAVVKTLGEILPTFQPQPETLRDTAGYV